MKTNHALANLRAGKPAIGCFMGLQSPNVAEMLANAGYDWLVIETEHNALDTAQVEHILMAINGTDTVPIVRIPSANPVSIQRALDIGGMGIVVPNVRTAEEAKAIVASTRYPPVGTRGYGPLRASRYTFDQDEYFEKANDNILVCLIVENNDAVENLYEIAAVDGVDVLFHGPADMSLALGLSPVKLPHRAVDQVFDRMLEVGQKRDVAIGKGCNTVDQLRQLQSRGATWIAYGPDYFLLRRVVKEGLEAFKR